MSSKILVIFVSCSLRQIQQQRRGGSPLHPLVREGPLKKTFGIAASLDFGGSKGAQVAAKTLFQKPSRRLIDVNI
jgi:hypothetical protein